jgi:hypothetical protein
MHCMQTCSVVSCLLLPYFFLSLFLSCSYIFHPTLCRCIRLLLHLITLSNTHSQTLCRCSRLLLHLFTLSNTHSQTQSIAETSIWQNTTDRYLPCRIRTRDPSKRTGAVPRLRPRGHVSFPAPRIINSVFPFKFIFGILQLFLIIISCPEYNFVLTKSQTFNIFQRSYSSYLRTVSYRLMCIATVWRRVPLMTPYPCPR